jgi:hypothetical protein
MATEQSKEVQADGKQAASTITTRRCGECSTRYTKPRFTDEKGAAVHCLPLEQRRGPNITDPAHPGHPETMANASWHDYLEAVSRIAAKVTRNGLPVVFGPFTGGPASAR